MPDLAESSQRGSRLRRSGRQVATGITDFYRSGPTVSTSTASCDGPPRGGRMTRVITIDQLRFRRLDPVADAEIALAHHRAANVASYGPDAPSVDRERYVQWL